MTQEQKDWYEYGRIITGYFACKSMGEPKNPAFIQAVWDARKKAHRWLGKNKCEHCKHGEEEYDGSVCPFCNAGENNYWEPKD